MSKHVCKTLRQHMAETLSTPSAVLSRSVLSLSISLSISSLSRSLSLCNPARMRPPIHSITSCRAGRPAGLGYVLHCFLLLQFCFHIHPASKHNLLNSKVGSSAQATANYKTKSSGAIGGRPASPDPIAKRLKPPIIHAAPPGRDRKKQMGDLK